MSAPHDSQNPHEPGHAEAQGDAADGGAIVSHVEDKDAKQWGMFAHLGGGLLGFIGPLIVYLVKKDDHPFVAQEAREALNFQIMILIGYVIGFVGSVASCGMLFFLPLIPYVVSLIFAIIGGVENSKGNAYRYPFNIRMVK